MLAWLNLFFKNPHQKGGKRESRKKSWTVMKRIEIHLITKVLECSLTFLIFVHISWFEIPRIFPNIAQKYMWMKKCFLRCIISNSYFVLKSDFNKLITVQAFDSIEKALRYLLYKCRLFYSVQIFLFISMKNITLNIYNAISAWISP